MDDVGRRQLVDDHLSLVRATATQVLKQLGANLEVDDLVAYGVQGLMEAAARFDETRGLSFVTYSYHRIRGAIYDGLRQMGSLRRADYARLRTAERAHEYVENLADREAGATDRPVATLEDDVRALHDAMAGVAATFVASYESLAEEGHEFIDEEGVPADELIAAKQMNRRVREALPLLPEKERHFIEKHYFQGKTLMEAGAELGLSKSWASRLHARAIDLLKEKLAENDP